MSISCLSFMGERMIEAQRSHLSNFQFAMNGESQSGNYTHDTFHTPDRPPRAQKGE
jgi:hypothetical protein